MAFKQQEVDQLLAETARRCCLCGALHKVQIHHIVPIEHGGTDDIDNAIPLCPNCHDEIHGGYAPGRITRAYTVNELKLHRKRTTEIVAKGEGWSPGSTSWEEDKELIMFYAQVLDRPAFRTSFHEELNFMDFDQAIEDTILALNTGYWRMRDGTLIDRAKGKMYIIHQDWRLKLDKIGQCLDEVRRRFREELGLKRVLLDWDHLQRWERRRVRRGIFADGRRGALPDPHDIDQHFRHNSRLAKWMNEKRQEAIDIFNSILKEIDREPLRGIGQW